MWFPRRATATCLTLAVFLSCAVVHAAYKPGWAPPGCLSEYNKPTNISIEIDPNFPLPVNPLDMPNIPALPIPVFKVKNRRTGQMESMFIRGIGYSPIPPSKYTFSQLFDVYTSDNQYLWERDLDRIKDMGVNVIRVWNWDSFLDHTAFLNALYDRELYIMVPFMMTNIAYKELSDPDTRLAVLTDWRAFVESVMNHPAVLCYLVGNELNTMYGSQREALFSLLNIMAQVRNDVDLARHPMTLPLSDAAFVHDYFNDFFAWSAIDFWALQSYRPIPYTGEPVDEYYRSYIVNGTKSGLPLKPLVLTEFGVDALQVQNDTWHYPMDNIHDTPQQPMDDEQKQARYFANMFGNLRDNGMIDPNKHFVANITNKSASRAGVVQGTVVMEWNDEWWKSNFASVRAPLCPNVLPHVHTKCPNNIGIAGYPYYLHEEWLGLSSQVYDSTGDKACLCPRMAYYIMKTAYACGGPGNTYCVGGVQSPATVARGDWSWDYFNCVGEYDSRQPLQCSEQWCSRRESLFRSPYLALIAPIVIILIAVSITAAVLRRRASNAANARAEAVSERSSTMSIGAGAGGERDYIPESLPTGEAGKKLKDDIAKAFAPYTDVRDPSRPQEDCIYFRPAQDRLFKLIWDKYVSAPIRNKDYMVGAVRIVYVQLMEGYHIWINQLPAEKAIEEAEMLKEMALYSIVQSWAGTINHAPEKVYEMFDFAIGWFEHAVPNNGNVAFRRRQVRSLHLGLVEITRTYYLKVDEATFTFEDINEDAINFRAALMGSSKKLDAKANFWSSVESKTAEDFAIFKREHETEDAQVASEPPAPTRDGSWPERPTKQQCPELDLLPVETYDTSKDIHPYLEYHKQRNPEATVKSDAAQSFFRLHKEVLGKKWMDPKEAFPQKGGPLTALFNFGWVIRYVLWELVWAKFFQPVSIAPPMCLCDAAQMLAIMDSGWMTFSALLHWRVLGFRLAIRPLVEAGIYGLFFAGTVLNWVVKFMKMPDKPPQVTVGNLFGIGWSVDGIYLLAAILVLVVEEVYLFLRSTQAYRMPARHRSQPVIRRIRIAFFIALAFSGILMAACWMPLGSGTIIDKLGAMTSKVRFWPNLNVHIWVVAFVLLTCLSSWGAARLVARLNVSAAKKLASQRQLYEEADVLVYQYFYWGVFVVVNFVAMFYIVVPAVNNITVDMCGCKDGMPYFSEAQERRCRTPYHFSCYVAVAFTWFSTILVAFVALYAVFELMLLVFGIIRAKTTRVGNVTSWDDVETSWQTIHHNCLRRASSCLLDVVNQRKLWNQFVEALAADCLLSMEEVKELTVSVANDKTDPPNFRKRPRSQEAIRRIKYYLWSFESLNNHEEVNPATASTKLERKHDHRVRTMPTWTCVIPAYAEPIILDEAQLIRARTEHQSHMRITEIEYLVHTYHDEWENFCEKIKKGDRSWIIADDNYTNDLVSAFLRHPDAKPISDSIRFEIRWWATMRGQTLARTIAGLINWRSALVDLIKMEEGDQIDDMEANRIVSRKCQILVSHQTGNPYADLSATKMEKAGYEQRNAKEDLEICFRRLKYFDVCYNDDKSFQSVLRRVKFEKIWGNADGQDDVICKGTQTIELTYKAKNDKGVEEVKSSKVTRPLFNLYTEDDIETLTVQRVGRLRIGEGKAENQMGAWHFVNGCVLQAMDMNQYATKENGYKVPYLLDDYFGSPPVRTQLTPDAEPYIPPYRILGFTEHCYTRPLSLVGEFMGAAEWCFVTITQRVLNWPLKLRLHYGHPDFFDAFWVRNRGGQSKASPLVHTNEDIFAGYEMLGRGDRGAFVEFLEAQKGRESTFPGAFTFEAKLAQGGAQQVRSFDVYRLNRQLDCMTRFGLFFSTLAFYWTNFLMAVSVKYYIFAIALFAISGVTYHELGLLDAVIAVPWLIQIGYVLAFPFIVELTIQRGLFIALWEFFRMIIPSVIFFIFHLRTKMCFFSRGLLVGHGGYMGTGRGFGLDRPNYIELYRLYSESHYHEALLITVLLIIYGVYGTDPIGAYLLRTCTILLIVLSWFWAPLIFSAAPTTRDLQADTKSMINWITGRFKVKKSPDEAAEKLELIHAGRTIDLLKNLKKQIAAVAVTAALTTNPEDEPSSAVVTLRDVTKLSRDETHEGALATYFRDSQQDDFTKALQTTDAALTSKLRQLEDGLASINKKTEKGSFDDVVKEYWGPAEDSWLGWWLRVVIVATWEAEDQYFPGVVNLVIQKCLLATETYAPWIVLALTQFNEDALWFIPLILGAVLVSMIVDIGFKDLHEYNTMIKSILVLTLPMAYLFFKESVMTTSELIWSLLLFLILTVLIVDIVFGAVNIVVKARTFRHGNPYVVSYVAEPGEKGTMGERVALSVVNLTRELNEVNSVEERRFDLFRQRAKHLPYIKFMRMLVPMASVVIVVIGNALTVVLSDWITAMNFNGRVTEAWKLAYVRPSVSGTGGGGGGGGGGGAGKGDAAKTSAAPTATGDAISRAQAEEKKYDEGPGIVGSSLIAGMGPQVSQSLNRGKTGKRRTDLRGEFPAAAGTGGSRGTASFGSNVDDDDLSTPFLAAPPSARNERTPVGPFVALKQP